MTSHRPKRVLFVLNTFYPGYMAGAEVSAYHTARQLRREGVDCALLVVNNRFFEHSLDIEYDYNGIAVHLVAFSDGIRSAWRDIYDGRIFRAVLAEIRRTSPDLVHIHNVSGASLAPFVAARRAQVPTVCTLHDLWLLCANNMRLQRDGSLCSVAKHRERCGACLTRYDYWADVPLRRRIFSEFTSAVGLFISPSKALIEQHVQAGYARQRFRMVLNSVTPLSGQEPSHRGVRDIVNSAPLFNTLVFAGGGTLTKGVATLNQAIPAMMQHVERFRVVVAGSVAEQHFGPAGERRGVHLLGAVPHAAMGSLYASADLAAIPSIWYENSPVVIYESFQVGTPVVGSAIGGIPELIDEGKTGYLFPAGNAAQLAERVIRHFARSAPVRRQMRHNCAAVARTRLSMARHIEGVMGVYGEAMAA